MRGSGLNNKLLPSHKALTMSTEILNYGANERRAVLLEKLGGPKVLRVAVNKFYDKQMNDERLRHFFDGVDVEVIKWHQFNLMSIAFTAIPNNFNVHDLLLNRHERLFDAGLSEVHFDVVAGHFEETLKEMNVDRELIDEALEVVKPLRANFKEGARKAKERKRTAAYHRRLVTVAAAALVVVAVVKLTKSKRK